MMLRRGTIAYVAVKGPYTGKPRPTQMRDLDRALRFWLGL